MRAQTRTDDRSPDAQAPLRCAGQPDWRHQRWLTCRPGLASSGAKTGDSSTATAQRGRISHRRGQTPSCSACWIGWRDGYSPSSSMVIRSGPRPG